ncbi:30S ribosomal protein S2 [candidate division KSB1 bacterium]|nr:30S ribosomal protein S2 [bacterium]RKY78139.1 MAG: 30S ribosomal protein S2 [candidate division KSB1 bacterium]HDI52198.1 30S ribosomal protein S2 [Bacteroidota bacterium]RKY82246.1 MAG: 30S ribosomal protein S2 [candidate division KSB1 bacterium]RKY88741.1 MAG: 30S ribosomal protein S2 [candidate division KSB1 bacterium]
MPEIMLEQLLMAGAHFGHLTRKWNPKMKPYIFMERNGIHIIDLKKTLELLQKSFDEVKKIVQRGEKILFVGTKKQARDIIRAEAERCGMFYVTNRWLGGTLTNFSTIKKSIKHLKNLEKMSMDGTYEKLTKKEVLRLERRREKMEEVLGGFKEMNVLPGALYVVDPKKEAIAVSEANKLGIPVFAMIDTNCDPDPIDFLIPANDDAFKSIGLITHAFVDAILEGLSEAERITEVEEEQKAVVEPQS